MTSPLVTIQSIVRTIDELRAKHRRLTASLSGSERASSQLAIMVCDDIEKRIKALPRVSI